MFGELSNNSAPHFGQEIPFGLGELLFSCSLNSNDSLLCCSNDFIYIFISELLVCWGQGFDKWFALADQDTHHSSFLRSYLYIHPA